jgi:hypothetical protein
LLRPRESHLGGFATADKILVFIHSILLAEPTAGDRQESL